MNIDEVSYALKNLLSRKTRSWLTILSILIGIMAIFAIMSFGLGIRNYVNEISEEAGADKLFLQSKGIGVPGTDETFYITDDDINFVGKIKGVDEISGMYMKVGEIEFKDQKKYAFVAGLDMSKIEFLDEAFTVTVNTGRHLKSGELSKVVLGYLYQFDNKIFKRGIKLGDKVTVNGHQFEVVGFYEEVGNPQDDSNIYLTDDAMEIVYADQDIEGKYGYVMIQSQKGVDPGELAERIEEKLRKYKGQEEGKEDFYVSTFADLLETFGMIFNVLNGVLALIALISLVVASVNTMNTMYTAVLERTKEIGVMKAIGAQNKDILFVFVLEAGFLGAVGGVIGVFFGYLISKAGGYIAAVSGYSSLQPIFPWYLTFSCILFAFLVGAGSGLLPAYQASRLKPVDALRYE